MARRSRRRLAVAALAVLAGAAALALHAPTVALRADAATPTVRRVMGPPADAGFAFLPGPIGHALEGVTERLLHPRTSGPLAAVLTAAAGMPVLVGIGGSRRRAALVGATPSSAPPGWTRGPPARA